MTNRIAYGVGALMAMSLIAACSGRTTGTEAPAWRAQEEQAARVAAGQRLFAGYCSSCHGAQGLGDGPVAPVLRVPPADLTRIAERDGGTFDAAVVAAYIDGRTRIVAHGERDMPVWGRMYDDRNENIASDETLLSPGMIFNIVEYLRAIQFTGAGSK
jgi:mono/diheme cytochrome c family protein